MGEKVLYQVTPVVETEVPDILCVCHFIYSSKCLLGTSSPRFTELPSLDTVPNVRQLGSTGEVEQLLVLWLRRCSEKA